MKGDSLLKKLFGPALLGMALTVVALSASAQQSPPAGLDTIRVGAVSAPPWYQKDLRTQQWVGLVPDLVQAIFKPYGVHIEYVDTQWGTAVAGLQSDRFDLLGGFNRTPERAKAVDFTRPIGSHKMGVLTLEDDVTRFQTWDSLNDPAITLAAIDGSAALNLLKPILNRTRWTVVPSAEAMQLEVESGRANALLTADIQMQQYIARRGRGQMVFPTPLQSQSTNIGLGQNRAELRDWLDQRLDQLDKDGTLERIWGQYVLPGK